eukprot:89799-Prorocentrum_minimum.AAC.1
MLAVGESGESSGRTWGTGQGGEKRGRGARMGVECVLAVIGTGGPVIQSHIICLFVQRNLSLFESEQTGRAQ